MAVYNLFQQILNMSITASIVILLVLLVRFCLKKMPKIYSYALWGVVVFRLLCPVSLTSELSVLKMVDAPTVSTGNVVSEIAYEYSVPKAADIEEIDGLKNSVIESVKDSGNIRSMRNEMISYLWVSGCFAMVSYGFFSYWKLRKKLVGAIYLKQNIYMADHIPSPFVLGVFRPRIYLLSSLREAEQKYIIMHEQHHIKRGDHIIKVLAYLALCIHWFNPLVWVSFVLSAKDMEMSCDEAVVRKLGDEVRSDYSLSLLSFATGQRFHLGVPLAFGEGDTKGRIHNLSRWKKPAVWGTILAVILCVVVIGISAFNPENDVQNAAEPFGLRYRVEEIVARSAVDSQLYTVGNAPIYALSNDYQLYILGNPTLKNWNYVGGFQEVELREENFEEYFGYLAYSPSKGNAAGHLLEENKKAWRLIMEKEAESSVFYDLLLQENGEVIIARGIYIPKYPENSRFNVIYKLEEINGLSCIAYSENHEAYIEMAYHPRKTGFEVENLVSGEMKDSGELVFETDWETEKLIVEEHYYEQLDAETKIQKGSYELSKNEEGKFVLGVSKRNQRQDEFAVYYIKGQGGTFAMRINFPINKIPVEVETYEQKNRDDVYEEWIRENYSKMSDGTWRVHYLNELGEMSETHAYKYRIVIHGTMPNAAVASNFILLSNLPDITFRRAWMASGLSSNLDDYFEPQEAIFVSSWLGDLETNHPQRDEDTIYVIEE